MNSYMKSQLSTVSLCSTKALITRLCTTFYRGLYAHAQLLIQESAVYFQCILYTRAVCPLPHSSTVQHQSVVQNRDLLFSSWVLEERCHINI